MVKIYREFTNIISILDDEEIEKIINAENNVFEGSQGTLLDCEYGFKPYITQTKTNTENALNLLAGTPTNVLGLLRPYTIRHGPGPFPTEDKKLDLEEKHNHDNQWQGLFRQGWLDLVLVKYSLAINKKINYLGLTCMDKVSGLKEINIAIAYEYKGQEKINTLQKYFDFDQNKHIIGIKLQKQDETIGKLLKDCFPVYTSLPGWQEDITKIKRIEELPFNTRIFLNYLEEQ
jgi:adenylosuccinate synthase